MPVSEPIQNNCAFISNEGRYMDEKILELWNQGLSRYQIADQLNIWPKDVHAAVMRGRRRADPRAVKRDRIEAVRAGNERRWAWLYRSDFVKRRELVKKFGAGSKQELIDALKRYRGE
jgi:hypothetical protein